jgi:hypothetical protein
MGSSASGSPEYVIDRHVAACKGRLQASCWLTAQRPRKAKIAEASEQTGRGNRQKNWLVIVLTVGTS